MCCGVVGVFVLRLHASTVAPRVLAASDGLRSLTLVCWLGKFREDLDEYFEFLVQLVPL